MNAPDFANLLAVLAIAAALMAVAVVVQRVRGRPLLDGRTSLVVAAAIAVTATAGSLVMSDVFHFEPCLLCWWQRILMYSSAVILTLAAVRRDLSIRPYVLALVVPGAAIGAWQALTQRIPDLTGSTACDPDNPCSLIWVEGLGFATIPTMAFIGFVAIATILVAAPAVDPAVDPGDAHDDAVDDPTGADPPTRGTTP